MPFFFLLRLVPPEWHPMCKFAQTRLICRSLTPLQTSSLFILLHFLVRHGSLRLQQNLLPIWQAFEYIHGNEHNQKHRNLRHSIPKNESTLKNKICIRRFTLIFQKWSRAYLTCCCELRVVEYQQQLYASNKNENLDQQHVDHVFLFVWWSRCNLENKEQDCEVKDQIKDRTN